MSLLSTAAADMSWPEAIVSIVFLVVMGVVSLAVIWVMDR